MQNARSARLSFLPASGPHQASPRRRVRVPRAAEVHGALQVGRVGEVIEHRHADHAVARGELREVPQEGGRAAGDVEDVGAAAGEGDGVGVQPGPRRVHQQQRGGLR